MSSQTKSDSKKPILIAVAIIAVIAVVLTVGFVSGLFTSSGNPQATPTPTATPTATPTVTPTPTATPTPIPSPEFTVTVTASDYNATMDQNTTYTCKAKITDHTFNQLVGILVNADNLTVVNPNNSTHTATGNLTTVLPVALPQLTENFCFSTNITISSASNGQFTLTFTSAEATTISGGIPNDTLAQALAWKLTSIIQSLM